MTDRAAIIAECARACEDIIFSCRMPDATDMRYGAQRCLDRIRALAAVPPAPPSIPERDKLLEALRYIAWIADDVKSAIAALEGK